MKKEDRAKLVITDFDGTLVDTFEANYLAYRQVFAELGFDLPREKYRACFGMRIDDFLKSFNPDLVKNNPEIITTVKSRKKEIYPLYFDYLKPNTGLLKLIRTLRDKGCFTAVASTASKTNLWNALKHIGAFDDFDLIFSGESVDRGKPDPQIYLKVLEHFNLNAKDALVFEDSEIGCLAAEKAGIDYIKIDISQ